MLKKILSNKKVIIAISLILVLLISGTIAYIISGDSDDNIFTVGNVKINLSEPLWTPNFDSDGDGKNDTLIDVLPTQIIPKNPTITNTGFNNAFVYMMIEVPKAYEVDVVGDDGSINKESHYQLFNYIVNNGWSLVSKQTTEDKETEGYNYYIYAYDTALKPNEKATLFNEMTFADVTSDIINNLARDGVVNLNINVSAYAIQSDFYGTEKIDAAKAWQKYVNQNGWSWPNNPYEGVYELSFVNEELEVLYTKEAYQGTPIEMYFDDTLVKDGYNFSWVNVSTNEEAYNGMPMPKEHTQLKTTYTDNGYGTEVPKWIKYYFYPATESNDMYLRVYDADTTHPDYPTEPVDIVIPSFISFTITSKNPLTIQCEQGIIDINSLYLSQLNEGETYTLPVKSIGRSQYTSSNAYAPNISKVAKSFILPDTIDSIYYYSPLGSDVTEYIKFPYDIKKFESISLGESIKEVILPNNLTAIPERFFMDCQQLKSVNIPKSVIEIGDRAFTRSGIESLFLPSSLSLVKSHAFYSCSNLKEIHFNSSVKFEDSCFESVSLKNVYCDTLENWCSMDFNMSGNETMNYSYIHGPLRSGTNLYINNKLVEGELIIPDMIKSLNDMTFYEIDTITKLVVPKTVTYIGAGAFVNNNKLTEIYYEGSLTDWLNMNIKNYTLFGRWTNSNIQRNIYIDGKPMPDNVVIPESITEIKNCVFSCFNNIKSVKLHDNITSIGDYAFYYCESLKTINVPDSVSYIGKHAFYYSSIQAINIPHGIESINEYSFTKTSLTSVLIPDSVTEIKRGAFQSCDNLEFITLSNNITIIDDFAFNYCINLNNIILPSSLSSIGEDAFENCSKFTNIIIPDNVTTIGSRAFSGCNSLEIVKLPYNLTSIYYNTFTNCTKLREINVAEDHPKYSSIDGVLFTKDITTLIHYPLGKTETKYIIPDTVTKIGSYAFDSNKTITEIVFPEGLVEIGSEAFAFCNNLSSVELPESLVKIGTYGFEACNSLHSVTIPPNLIDAYQSFYNCDNLKTVNVKSGVTKLDTYMFSYCDSLSSVYLPDTLTEVRGYAFYKCTKLTDVYYVGNESEWNSIEISAYNEPLINATKHFNSTY